MDPAALRAEFPVLERLAYLNAGTDGPLAAAAVKFAQAELESELTEGRATPHFERRFELQAGLRAGYARVMGCAVEDVALTTSTSEGIAEVMAGMDLGPGDEIVSSDQEHPGVIGPLKAAKELGATVRLVPFQELADAVTATTTLVVCSHVGWVSGELAPAELAELAIPVILDGAQGSGAVPVDVQALNCAAYAAAGQKWLCGADGSGMLYVSPAWRDRIRPTGPSYISFEDTTRGLESPYKPDARRFDTPSLSREVAALSLGRARGARAPRPRRHPRPRPRAGRDARGEARGGRPHGRPARRQHARRLGGRRPRGHRRAPARRGHRRAQPARAPAAARVRRRVERRRGPRPPAGRDHARHPQLARRAQRGRGGGEDPTRAA